MGCGTYAPTLAAGGTSPYPRLRQYVFSTALADPGPDVRIVSGDAAKPVADLKQRDGMDLWLCGGTLSAQRFDEIDELVTKHYPATIGAGIPLFDRPFTPPTSNSSPSAPSRGAGRVAASRPHPDQQEVSPIVVSGRVLPRVRTVGPV